MKSAEYVFWVCLLLIAHTYVFYPVALFVAYALSQIWRDWHYLTERRNRRAPLLAPEQLPGVTLIVPAHNEELSLPEKIANLQQVNYPREKLEVIFISDGSTDRTSEILGSLQGPDRKAVLLPVRQGKSNALNVAVAGAQHDILVFSDATTLFAPEALNNLVRHFTDPRVGVVCGALEFRRTTESQQTEGIYWKFESVLRLMEARLGATLTASGAIYALRRQCYLPLALDNLIDDFVIPMNARGLGYRVLYDPEAVATESAASSVAGEFTRRVRLAVGSYRALGKLAGISLRSFTFVAFFSHKLLRWILPFLLIGLLVSNALLSAGRLYRLVFAGQLLFYLWACMGFVFRARMQRVRYALVAYFLLAMHLAFLVGFVRFLAGREEATWQRVH